jgi:uncharacterized membrane protein
MSSQENLVLYAATYADRDGARADFDDLKAAEGPDLVVAAAIVMSRDANGRVDVLESGDGDTATGAMLGGGAGLVIGLFAPPLLASTAIGAGIGALLGHLTKKHEEKELGVELDEYFPASSSAVVAVVDDVYLDRLEAVLAKASKRVSKAIDRDDYDKLVKAVSKSTDQIDDALET